MKTTRIVLLAALCLSFGVIYAQGDDPEMKQPVRAVEVPKTVVNANIPQTFTCPVMGEVIPTLKDAGGHLDIKGVRYYVCCNQCMDTFPKDYASFIKKNNGKNVIGLGMFDPISTKSVNFKNAVAYSDYKGVRYLFESDLNKTAFDKESVKYSTTPSKELLYCPVNKEKVASYEKASDYSDYKGTRYYFCCAGCKPAFEKDPQKYVSAIPKKIK